MEIIYKKRLSDEAREKVNKGFNNQAVEMRGLKPTQTVALEMIDDDNQFIGAAISYFMYGSIYTDILFIEKAFRGKGYGEKLLKKVEEWGKKQGAHFATLDTFDFQARDFYERCGYKVEFIRKGYDKGCFLYKMRKEL